MSLLRLVFRHSRRKLAAKRKKLTQIQKKKKLKALKELKRKSKIFYLLHPDSPLIWALRSQGLASIKKLIE